MEKILRFIERLIPRRLYKLGQPIYHYLLAITVAIIYRFPSRHLTVIGVTGTKGKSSTVELINTILEAAGHRTALISTVRLKIGNQTKPNLYKMTMPGRFTLQRLLREAVSNNCEYAIVEMSSEGTRFFRHKFIFLNILVFTNLAPEHIESHGSYENYRAAKLKLATALEHSPKRPRYVIANGDDNEGWRFLDAKVESRLTFHLKQAEPYTVDTDGITITYQGAPIKSSLPGTFSIYNMLAAITVAETQKIKPEIIKSALENFTGVPGRAERIQASTDQARAKQNFTVVVDYAHTPDSLKAIYEAFPAKRRLCVLGGTGGGRDTWKRPLMGSIAEEYCDEIFLTDEDPYDEDSQKIVGEVASGIKSKKFEIVMDRREAIRRAIAAAQPGEAVLITGKGTDPYIMGPRGTKIPWSDARIASEELDKILESHA